VTKTKHEQAILCEHESGKASILSHFWFPFRNFRCCVLFSLLSVHTHSIQLHTRCTEYPLWDLMQPALGTSNVSEASLGVVTAVFNSVPKICCMESQYIVFMYPQNSQLHLNQVGVSTIQWVLQWTGCAGMWGGRPSCTNHVFSLTTHEKSSNTCKSFHNVNES